MLVRTTLVGRVLVCVVLTLSFLSTTSMTREVPNNSAAIFPLLKPGVFLPQAHYLLFVMFLLPNNNTVAIITMLCRYYNDIVRWLVLRMTGKWR